VARFLDPRDPDRVQLVPAVLDHPARFPLCCVTLLARDDLRLELHWRLFVNGRLMPVELRLLSLSAGLAHAVEDPGPARVVFGPPSGGWRRLTRGG
jgi:hypothetical protein